LTAKFSDCHRNWTDWRERRDARRRRRNEKKEELSNDRWDL
jgi:hypothetical protein